MDDFTPLFRYIEAHIEDKLDLKELSNFMGYSPYYLSRKFMNDYGMPLTGYVRIRKLQYSINDLLAGMKVIDVAMKYSFESHEGFTRSFNSKMSLVDDMHKIIYTILSNSFEELSAGFCSKIELRLLSNNTISIFDDGRGIKLDDGGEVHEEVLQNLFSGKPITKVEYVRMGDLPFDELKLVNSLCESLQITVWRNGNIYRQDYVRGVPQHALTAKQNDSQIPHGTQIILKPDSVIFGDTAFSREKLQNWVNDNYSELAEKASISY